MQLEIEKLLSQGLMGGSALLREEARTRHRDTWEGGGWEWGQPLGGWAGVDHWVGWGRPLGGWAGVDHWVAGLGWLLDASTPQLEQLQLTGADIVGHKSHKLTWGKAGIL